MNDMINSMKSHSLTESLDNLHLELSKHPQLDEASVQRLRELVGEIQTAIGDMAVSPGSREVKSDETSITVRLQESIRSFEAQHPQLTTMLSQIADRLSDMGI